MKTALVCLLLLTATACGSTTKETVVHDQPVVVQPAATTSPTPGGVESSCAHGYDNSTHACY